MWSRKTLLGRERFSISKVEQRIEDELKALVDITQETVCLKEIKDILDELNSVSYIFGQQITVVQSIVDEYSLLEIVQDRNTKANKTSNEAEASPPRESRTARGKGPRAESQEEPGTTGNKIRARSSNVQPPDKAKQVNSIIATFSDELDESAGDAKLKYEEVLKTLKKRTEDIEKLKKNAYTVYKDVRIHCKSFSVQTLTSRSCVIF